MAIARQTVFSLYFSSNLGLALIFYFLKNITHINYQVVDWHFVKFSFDLLTTVWSNHILVSQTKSLLYVRLRKTMTWETFKLILFSIGLLLSFYKIYERRKDGKKIPYTSIVLVVLFVVLILGKFLWFWSLDKWCGKWWHPYSSSNH